MLDSHRYHSDEVGADALDLARNLRARSLAYRDQRHHGGHTDDHPQHGEQ